MTNEQTGWSHIYASMTPEETGFRVDIPPHWKQGRTAYGGLTAALMLAGAQKQIEGLPPLRSALINFVGPVTDSPLLTAELQRKGRNVTSVSAAAHIVISIRA